ncbi:hypothetical protein AB0G86_25095 [Streptomyces scabiei]|uniref:hypothetical protein n=1 Tax=Streptomyces scabiei TaxID=1930 RepID=UPI0033C19EBC
MSWATTTDVLAITGITVTDADITQAQYLVEMFAGTTEESDDFISDRNMRHLKLAVSYQTVWMLDHPDVFSAIDVTSATQDGLSWTISNPQQAVVAPLARMAIARLSWNRNRSVYIRPSSYRGDVIPQTLNTTNVDLDDRRTDWRPL